MPRTLSPALAQPRTGWGRRARLQHAAAATLGVLSVVGCASARTVRAAERPGTRGELRHAIDSLVAQPKFSNAHWGILIVDPERGDTIYSRNAGKLFMPASNQKIVTGSVALGPSFSTALFRKTSASSGSGCA